MHALDLDALLAHVTAAARHAGEFLAVMSRDRSHLAWQAKTGTDFVSEADLGAEARLRERLLDVHSTPGVPPDIGVTMLAVHIPAPSRAEYCDLLAGFGSEVISR